MLYSWVALPMFVLMITSLSGIHFNMSKNYKILSYLCKISYAFFFAQFFVWDVSRWFFDITGIPNSNITRIVVSFLICMLITIAIHELIENPLKKLIKGLQTVKSCK